MATQRFAFLTLIWAFLANLALAEDRSITGTGNNLSNATLGSANQPLIRFNYKPDFPNNQMITDALRANARDISNAIDVQTASQKSARGLSDYIWAWGQFLTHDTDLTSDSNGATVNGSAPIAINSSTDPLGPNAIPFVRDNFVNTGRHQRPNPRQRGYQLY